MSRILRRPMFRGGPVSSYGKGIAAPLVPGYAGGGQIGGGIIYGKPMADGRYGFGIPKQKDLFNVEDSLEELTVGSELGHLTAPLYEPIPEVEDMSSVETVNTTDEYITVPKRTRGGTTDETTVIKNPNYEPPTKTVTVGRGETEVQVPLSDDEIAVQESLKKDFHPGQVMNTKENIEANGNDNFEITPEVDARTAVAENKALFADLLGVDKARGQDISDMLLGFAGAEGEGWDKFQRFAAAESQRPGRRQKIEDAAGTLAIQDYIAGKRSKEQMAALTGKIDYEYDKKLKMSMPQKDDTAQVALYKIAALTDSKSGSDSTIKEFIKFKTGKPTVRNDKVKMKDIDNPKKQKKLIIGYNIIEDEKTGKNIVYWDGTTANIVTLQDIWAQE